MAIHPLTVLHLVRYLLPFGDDRQLALTVVQPGWVHGRDAQPAVPLEEGREDLLGRHDLQKGR